MRALAGLMEKGRKKKQPNEVTLLYSNILYACVKICTYSACNLLLNHK